MCVILNHAVNRAYAGNYFAAEFAYIPLLSSLFKALCQVISRFGVPLFLMISGSLLLEKKFETKDDVKRFYKNNLLPLFVTTEVWMFIMFWYRVLLYGFDESIWHTVLKSISTMLFINQNTMRSMWYMVMILSVYLIIPILAMVKDKLPVVAVICPLLLVCVTGFFIPSANAVFDLLGSSLNFEFGLLYAELFSRFIVYIVLGNLIYNGLLRKIKSGILSVLFAVLFVGTVVFQFWAYSQSTMDYTWGTTYYSFVLLFISVLLFEMLRRIRVSSNRFVTYIAKISFGIYFVHICIMEGVKILPGISTLAEPIKLVIFYFSSFLGAVALVCIFSKSKFAGKILFNFK